MISMTGFAYREFNDADISLSVEIKGYNNRFLELFVNMPPWLSHLEPKVRGLLGNYCGRGKVEVLIRLREKNTPVAISINTCAAIAYLNAVSGLCAGLGEEGIHLDGQLSIPDLLKMDGVLDSNKIMDSERYWNVIEPLLQETAAAFQSERSREGMQTESDILGLLNQIENALEIVVRNTGNIENTIKENITSRFSELCGAAAGVIIDDNRILAETAILLMKYTISEEIARLHSHIAEFKKTVNNERPGKKLDFLCQEINREINTIGSKNTIVEVSRAVVEMKESLENIREQLRNIE